MSFQIASLFAKIGADTTDLNRGLQNANAKLDETAGKMQGSAAAAGEADSSTKSFGTTLAAFAKMAGVAVGAIAAVGIAAKKAFDFASEGAEIQQLRDSFNLMNDSVFRTPGLLDDMSEAVRGTISETKLMAGLMTLTAGTSRELGGALAEASPRLL